jgi:hypothetical protein
MLEGARCGRDCLMDRQALAQAAGEAIWRDDRVSKWLGMKLEELKPGYARMTMLVTEQMSNAQALCHGGVIFALADSAFGMACNSHNHKALAASCSIARRAHRDLRCQGHQPERRVDRGVPRQVGDGERQMGRVSAGRASAG